MKYQATHCAAEAILGQRSAHSLATGPVIAEPFISPLLFTITPALSSKYINVPSFRLNVFLCLITTAGITRIINDRESKKWIQYTLKSHSNYLNRLPFFLKSGFPFLTVAMIMSPTQAAGNLLSLAPKPLTAIVYKFLAPVLSAQLITAPTGKPSEILNLPPPTPPLP